jgi:UDP-N-acetylmuramoyl-tripeptide--D-alanyl-D-alanine ligase
MIAKAKRILYFFVARYFRFFAAIRLARWKPRIILVTGSSGKTTLLHLLEAQLGAKAKYSHHANSAFGISFNILGIERTSFRLVEWFGLFARAPFAAFRPAFAESIYVVEADCDRPYEGKFIAEFLNPSIVLWLSLSRTHSHNFTPTTGRSIEQTIAHEFGYFAASATDLVIANADVPEIKEELNRSHASKIIPIHLNDFVSEYTLTYSATEFIIKGQKISLTRLVPREVGYAIVMVQEIALELRIPFDPTFPNFHLPPSRGSVFPGIKNTTLVDSSYNASLESMRVMLELFKKYPATEKWIVLGDMIELGAYEQEEHEKLVAYVSALAPKRTVLVGPRLQKYTQPLLVKTLDADSIVCFDSPKDALDYLTNELHGGETILFKGARFLEGIVAHLLYNQSDQALLCRRGEVWDERRTQWGL